VSGFFRAGEDWESKLESFDMTPIAAASIGQVGSCTPFSGWNSNVCVDCSQVHKAVLKDGRHVVMKVQYPGKSPNLHSVRSWHSLAQFF
jgi:hypothetical protein